MRTLIALLLMILPTRVLAEVVVVSDAPTSTSVTVYQDANRSAGQFNPRWLQGYALISEKRRISLPAGESVVRFEGVADGMLAVSAVVSGLPGGLDERNRDVRLLSPAALLDGTLGNRVHIRRTSLQTGKVTEMDAIIRSGAAGAVVLQTAEGVEALRCSGLPEAIIYDMVPAGLSAKPTFSVRTSTPAAMTAEVTLTYLATGFDWNANYVAKVAEDGKTLDLFAWLTVANGNGAAYPQTQLLAVAGKLNRSSDFQTLAGGYEAPSLALRCWPMDGTSTYPGFEPQVPPPAPPPMVMAEVSDIIVTGAKRSQMLAASPVAVVASQEELGDLKLYRVPVPVDVLPNGQKQVALLEKKSIPFKRVFAVAISPWDSEREGALDLILRLKNEKSERLGVPLPSGGIVVMQQQDTEEMLVAQGGMADRAVGERVEIVGGVSDQVRFEQKTLSADEHSRRVRIVVTNALDRQVAAELRLPRFDNYRLRTSAKAMPDGGGSVIAIDIPANGERHVVLDYIVN